MRTSLSFLVLCAAVAVACTDGPDASSALPLRSVGAVPYALDAPEAVLELPYDLREISGLTLLPSGNLGAVQDERGVVYEVDPATGRVVSTLSFAGAGDFEGIELTPEAVWALRSDGDLYRLYRDSSGTPTSQKYETDLGSRNDTEGLAYDAAGGRLLVACKEDPGDGLDGVRAVYAFDLASRTLSPRPAFLLDRAQIDGDDAFKPSALAVHPQSRTLYVLSSVRKAVATFAPDGTFLSLVPLDARLFPQPEGLAFAADGTLFIANEGPLGPGTILRFSPDA